MAASSDLFSAIKRRAMGLDVDVEADDENNDAEDSVTAPKSKVRKLGELPELMEVCAAVEPNAVAAADEFSSSCNGNSNENTPTAPYHTFYRVMSDLLETHADFINHNSESGDEEEDDEDADAELLSEIKIPINQLDDFCTEAAKLKASGFMSELPENELVKLLKLLELNIREGCKATVAASPLTHVNSMSRIHHSNESIHRGCSSCLTALHILTSPNMPKIIYLEDLIHRIVQFTKFQLDSTIYPFFDPLYQCNLSLNGCSVKRTNALKVRDRSLLLFYTKSQEVVIHLAELLKYQILTDTTMLPLSKISISPFFVENVTELQLASLKLATGVFTQYKNYRTLILDDILASLSRLPTTKRNLRTVKISAECKEMECIQMFTSLVLQLVQSITISNIPEKIVKEPNLIQNSEDNLGMIFTENYDTASRTGGNFLTYLFNQCSRPSEDCNYKAIFDNFLQDLLSVVNKPEWPSAELLLSHLGVLLAKNVRNKYARVPDSVRVISLEYLGIIAARLRKDAIYEIDTIDNIIADINVAEGEDLIHQNLSLETEKYIFEGKVKFMQRLLLDYLKSRRDDLAFTLAQHFYITSWCKSSQNATTHESPSSPKEMRGNQTKPKSKPKNKIIPLTSRTTKEALQSYIVDRATAERITCYLVSLTKPYSAGFEFFLIRILSASSDHCIAVRTKSLRCLAKIIEVDPGVLARPEMELWVHSSLFDRSTAVREAGVQLVGKYVGASQNLIEKYYDILTSRISDIGLSVRKRVIQILSDICVEYPKFPRISETCVKMIRRINDQEEGVRELVKESFKKLWFTPSDKNKITQITDVVASCKNASDGLDFLEQLLSSIFKPHNKDEREKLVNQEPPKSVLIASARIVKCIVQQLLNIEGELGQDQEETNKFIASVATLKLFAKIRPQLLAEQNHIFTLEKYLSMQCSTQAEFGAIGNIENILGLTVPLLANPSESFLAKLEADCVKLLRQNDKFVVASSLECLAVVVNKMTKNYKLVRDIFGTLRKNLKKHIWWIRHGDSDYMVKPPMMKYSIYTIGLFLRYFDFKAPEVYGKYGADIVNLVFVDILYLFNAEPPLQLFCLEAIGNLCLRHYDYMFGDNLKNIYQIHLANPSSALSVSLKVQILRNIENYLLEDELRSIEENQDFITNKSAKLHDIKKLGDKKSGISSIIIQIYLKHILKAYLNSDLSVRLGAVKIVKLISQQGLVQPQKIVPYLICMSTDDVEEITVISHEQLLELHKKYPQIESQVLLGIKLSLQLQRLLHGYNGSESELSDEHDLSTFQFFHSQSSLESSMSMSQRDENDSLRLESNFPIVRGYTVRTQESSPSALNGFVYSLVRSTKPQRRALAQCLLNQFDEQNKNGLADLLYFADNLAYFPYCVLDEPLFIIHLIDMKIAVTGSSILRAINKSFQPAEPHGKAQIKNISDFMGDDEDEDVESIFQKMTEHPKPLEKFLIGSQGCLLLLMLKQHLKKTYGLTDARLRGYSPWTADASKAKTNERPVTRVNNIEPFEPKTVLGYLQEPPSCDTPVGRRVIAEQYLQFKQLMLQIDPQENEN